MRRNSTTSGRQSACAIEAMGGEVRVALCTLNQTAFVPPFDLYPSGAQIVYIRGTRKGQGTICIKTVLKVHKREIFYGSDFEIFTFS